jgi:hypothetical protein
MKSLFIITVIILSLSGCAFERLNYIKPKADLGSTYTIAKEVTASTGSQMIGVFNLYRRDAFRPRYKFTSYTPGVGYVTVYPTSTWIVRGIRDNGMLNIVCPEVGWRVEFDVFRDGTVSEKLKDKLNLPDTGLFDPIGQVLDDDPQLNHFRAELIYTGISKNTIRIAYREYVKDMARPAFFQDLSYDLDESDTLQFKSIRIKILQANNSLIKFIVIDDQGLPWLRRN